MKRNKFSSIGGLIVFAMSFSALMGCKKDKAGPPPPELSVSLITPGAEPRTKLRYAIAAGTVARSTLEIRTAAITTEDVQDTFEFLPGVRLALHLGPTVALPDQLTRYVLRISRASPLLPEGTEVDHRQHVEQGVRALNDTRGRFDLSDRGIVQDADVPWTTSAGFVNPRVTIMLGNVRSAIATIPFPVEPVGIGAVWEVRRPLRILSARVTQVVRYELVDHSGDQLRVKVSVVQSASPQIADLNPQLEMHVRTYEMRSEGHALVDLGLPIAVEATLEASSEVDLALVSPEKTQPLQSQRRSALRLSTESER